MNPMLLEGLQHAVWENVVIRASAGTGKTFQLSNRFLQLVLAGQAVDCILATTFTRKAAGEILQRVMHRLAAAASDEVICRQLADELDWPRLSSAECRSVLRRITQQLHRLRVATLDAFFLQATQSLSLELGLPPQWRIVDELEERQIRDEAIVNMLLDEKRDTVVQLMHWLTKGEARRGVHELVRDTVSAVYDVFLEAPPACWKSLVRRATLNDAELKENVRLLESADASASLRKTVEQDLVRIESGDWDEVIKKGIAAKVAQGETHFNRQEIPLAMVQPYQRLVAHAIAELNNRVVAQTESTYDLVQRFHQHYETIKRNRRVLLFGDLARHLAAYQGTNQMRHLAFRLDGTIESLLLDEFQDTSLYQWQVIRPFASHAASADPGRSLLCVGDQKQAIYGWRGGNADLLDAVGEELAHANDRTLETSYRSSPEVISAVNQINLGLVAHPNLRLAGAAVERWCENFPTHRTARTKLAGRVTLRTSRAALATESQRDVTLRDAAERVQRFSKDAPGASVAILVRTNESVGKLIYELHRLGVPASEEGGNPLVDSAAVQLVLSLLRLGDHPGDTIARYHLSQSAWGSCLGLECHRDFDQAVRLSRAVRRSLTQLGFGAAVLGWAEQLRVWCNQREWRRLLQLVELAYVYQGRLETPRAIGHQLQHRCSTRCDAFVALVENQRVSDPSEDRVRVMTIHQAKGLQFDLVVLPDLDRELLPMAPRCVVQRPRATEEIDLVCRYANSDLRRHLPAKIQRMFDDYFTQTTREELCVMYVALTRAVHGLELIIAPSRASERSIPVTAAGLIRAALTDQQRVPPDKELFAIGDERWWRSLPPHSSAERPDERVIDQVRLASQPTSMHRCFEAARPSTLEGEGLVRLGDRLSLPNANAMQFGSLIHLFFEQVQWIEHDLPDDDALLQLARRNDVEDEHIWQAIRRFRRMIAQPEVSRILSASHYAPLLGAGRSQRLEVRCEQPLLVSLGETMLSGAIDRLVVTLEGEQPVAADVIDFKTDVLNDQNEMHRRADYYRPQLEAYAAGVQRMLRLPAARVSARLIFLALDRVVTIC